MKEIILKLKAKNTYHKKLYEEYEKQFNQVKTIPANFRTEDQNIVNIRDNINYHAGVLRGISEALQLINV